MLGAAGLGGQAGRAFVFGRTGPLQPVTLNTDVLNDALYHYRGVWTQRYKPGFPFWRVLGGVAVAGGIYYAIDQSRKKTTPSPNSVGLRRPP
jgi:hypothetical protein